MSRLSLKRPAARLLLVLGRGYLGLALRTTRWTMTGNPSALPVLLQPNRSAPHNHDIDGHTVDDDGGRTDDARGCIVGCWHRALLMLPAMCAWGHVHNPALIYKVMISRNRDGRFINDLVAPWGITGVEGSSDRQGKNKGGSRALRQACADIKAGAVFAITPDGPRGPAETVQPGASALTRLTGRPLVPVGGACSSVRLPSWDGLRIPLPFGRGYMIYGAPLAGEVAPSTIETELKRLSARAERSLASGRTTLADRIWQGLGTMLMPLLRAMMLVRLRRGKERLNRLPERRGRASLPRPSGQLLWIHAASVGETHSVLPLIDTLAAKDPSRSFLLTTATTGGADIVAQYQAHGGQGAQRTSHQFIPYDTPLWTRRFLDHWRPSALLLTDSELWPGLVLACTRRAIPVGVLNGRLSTRSWQRWKKLRRYAPPLFERLDFIAARGEEDAAHFRALGVGDVLCFGDLKQNAPPPPVDETVLAELRAHIGSRHVFLAASTHEGEDEIILRAASRVRERYPDLLTVIAPRHPVRGSTVAKLSSPHAPRRAAGQLPEASDPVWIADTLGEMGLFYRLAHCALIGHSLIAPGGGHNPFEAVHLDVPLATGIHCGNFSPAFRQLEGCVMSIEDETQLAGWIIDVTEHPELWADRADRAKKAIQTEGVIPDGLIARIDALCA
ncbi:glycosyltransferase N-terminal domain-containing protein [Asaia lannensis]|uniref:3-deoxy-D-manno-octulosonic acid transferase n=1 Tax=Asaia lannensis NBRC 102526 TaxID=1307926 RepID=A0ABT1CDV8_9PROT|nr:glycosyltransferase N-terminal domain-containing protein [Asaia lannensis]MCO6158961.1 DUF374 domain-containing protein [Asaia lannensis NBRC 102526]GBQ96493.1 3-deoxy-D-manno-octulosonic-acid transferase [Asaia lannensis NBRC 102526]